MNTSAKTIGNTKPKWVKGALALLLAVAMVVTMTPLMALPANAAGADQAQEKIDKLLNPAPPDGYSANDESNPFGYDKGVPFRLYEDAELYEYTADINEDPSISEFAKVYQWFKKQDGTGLFDDHSWNKTENLGVRSEKTFSDGEIEKHWFMDAVPIDMGYNDGPRNSGIAFIGAKQNGGGDSRTYDIDVWVYDTKSRKYSNVVKIGEISNIKTWDNKDTTETKVYQMRNFMSITAGDYDGDKKDSIVAYGAFSDGPSLSSIKVEADGNSAPDITRTLSTAAMLHDKYLDNYSRGKNYKSDTSANGYLKLGCSLESGDVTGDKIDDLVAVSYTQMPSDADVNKLGDELVMPQLAISKGGKGKTAGDLLGGDSKMTLYAGTESKDSQQMHDCTERSTVQTPTVVIANTEISKGPGIVIGGYLETIFRDKGTNEVMNVQRSRAQAAAMVYSVSDKGLDRKAALAMDICTALKSNVHQQEKRTTFPKLPVASVSLDGTCQKDRIFIGGSFYDFGESEVKKLYTIPCLDRSYGTGDFGGDYIEEVYIDDMAVASLNKVGGNYESLAFSLVAVSVQKDDFAYSPYAYYYNAGVAGPKIDGETGRMTGYYGTAADKLQRIKVNVSGTDFDILKGVCFTPYNVNRKDGSPASNHVICPVDCVDNVDDGMTLRYNGSRCLYADPQILAVLQASPAFGQLDQSIGGTEYSFTNRYSYSDENSNTYSYGVGIAANLTTPFVEASLRVGYSGETRDWTEKEFSEEHTESFEANHDSVIVYRTPIINYSYDVWKPDKGTWEEEGFAVSYVRPGEYQQLSVEEYNQFADEYNKEGQERYKKKGKDPKKFTTLDKLTDDKYLGCEGEPAAYYQGGQTSAPTPEGYKVVDENVHRLGYNGGTDSTEYVRGSSVTEGKEKSDGVSVEFDIVGGPEVFKAGVYGSFEYLTGHSTSETNEKSTGIRNSVDNLDEGELKDKGYTDEQIRAHQFNWIPAKWDSGIKYIFAKDTDLSAKGGSDENSAAVKASVSKGAAGKAASENNATAKTSSGLTVGDDPVSRSVPIYGYSLSNLREPYNLDHAKVTLDPVSFDYDGKPKEPKVTVATGDKQLKDSDYTVSYMADGKKVDNCTQPNSYCVVAEGAGGNIGQASAYFMIIDKSKKDLSGAEMTLDYDKFAYDGKAKSPKATVVMDGKTLKEGKDYDIEYSRVAGGLVDKCADPGDYNIIAEGKGAYTGATVKQFKIVTKDDPISIKDKEVTLSDKEFAYTGNVQRPAVMKIDGRDLEEGTDYSVKWSDENSKDPGSYTLTVTGENCYTGQTTASYKIDDPISIQDAKVVLTADSFAYDGDVHRPGIVSIGGMKLDEGDDYTVDWSDKNSKNPGSYTLTVNGQVAYTGQTSAKYKIYKATNKLNLKGKTIKVKFKRLKKKPQKFAFGKLVAVTDAVGNISYKLVKVSKKGSGNKYAGKFKIDPKTGRLTVKKKLGKGTYKVTVNVTASGNATCDPASKDVTFTVKVK